MLRVENLVAGYRTKPIAALRSLIVNNGEVALLLGPSGSGKTTLLLALAGLAHRFGGVLDIDGVDPTALRGAQRDRFRGREIGIVFQDLHLIAGLSTLDNLLLAPFASKQTQDRVRAVALLEQLGLGPQVRQRAETLSRGQAQRVAIARAMLLRPKLILADEPTASLDDEACHTVGMLLEAAARDTNASLVIATHDLRLKAMFPTTVQAEPLT
jgi:putative ABC transport system ATP-binding protein